jgi:Flp pilus assembly protein TadD
MLSRKIQLVTMAASAALLMGLAGCASNHGNRPYALRGDRDNGYRSDTTTTDRYSTRSDRDARYRDRNDNDNDRNVRRDMDNDNDNDNRADRSTAYSTNGTRRSAEVRQDYRDQKMHYRPAWYYGANDPSAPVRQQP